MLKDLHPPPEQPDKMILRPVGFVRNQNQEPSLLAGSEGLKRQENSIRHMYEKDKDFSEIIINEDLIDILDGIEQYSHITVLYWAHRVPEQSRSLTRVHPMGRRDFPLVGIFGTCSPARPNPVLMTVVRLRSRKGNVLEVLDLDAVNGSPVIDIKPYVNRFYPQEEIRTPEWIQKIQKELRQNPGE